MPARSAIAALPAKTRKALEARLVQGGFSRYTDLAQWLAGEGFEISRSALHRFGKDFQARIDAIRKSTEMARALREQCGDDDGALNDASLRMAQRLLFDVLQQIEASDIESIEIPKLVRALADLSRASVTQKKWQQEYDEKLAARAEAAAEKAESIARSGGLSEDGVRAIREQFLGLRA